MIRKTGIWTILNGIFLRILFDKLIISIPINNTDDKFCWNFTPTGIFFVKYANCANNANINHIIRLSFNSFWRLNMKAKFQMFAWKLLKNMLPPRANSES